MRKVFYSFYYDEDVMRVMNIRQMGIFEEDKPVQPNTWELVRRTEDEAIKGWIDKTMASCSCVVVLIGEHTYQRKWVHYEIEHAWNAGKGLAGVYIHDLYPVNEKLAKYGECGENPFSLFEIEKVSLLPIVNREKENVKRLDSIVPLLLPKRKEAYEDIKSNISSIVEKAIAVREYYKCYICNMKRGARIASTLWGKI